MPVVGTVLVVPAPLVPGTGVGGLEGLSGLSRSGRVSPDPSVAAAAAAAGDLGTLPERSLNLFWG